jgi:phage terminase Nu1 subunit (DNA packaging protein)
MPLEIKAALAWLNTRPDQQESGDDDGSISALRKERIRLVRLQSEKAAIELDVRKGELASRAEIEAAFTAIGTATKAAMLALRKELPPALLGLPLNFCRSFRI